MGLLSKTVIAVVGTGFGDLRGLADIEKWVTANGGEYSREVNKKVTHLLCDLSSYKRNVTAVQLAKHLKIKIVDFDWLETTLDKRRRPLVKDHLLENKLKQRKREKQKKKEERKERRKAQIAAFQTASRDFKQKMHSSSGYTVYHDPNTSFLFDILLVRPHVNLNVTERLKLRIMESVVIPKKFACFAIYYTPMVKREITEVLASEGSSFEDAYQTFTSFFRARTGNPWESSSNGTVGDCSLYYQYTPS